MTYGRPKTTVAPRCDVAIIGAGPYGLALKASLSATDLDVRLIGRPMSFWRERMPAGMLIRSPWVATSFVSGGDALSLDDYERSRAHQLPRRLPLAEFIGYGEWFRQRVSPDVDERTVERLSPEDSGFRLELSDGDRIDARRVVVAAGIEAFAARPAVFEGLASEVAFHTTKLTDPSRLAGSRVIVIGAGQSALESAALLREAGSEVEVLVRAPRVHYLNRSGRLHSLGPLTKLLYSPTDIGPAGLSRLVAVPRAFGSLPYRTRERLDRRAVRPAASDWLVPRLRDMPITLGVEVESAAANGSGVSLRLSSGQQRHADHVVLGTGFRIDVWRYAFLGQELAGRLRCVNGYPVLNRSFESSIPGLYFLGAPAAGTFGPLFRFVAGADFAARSVAEGLAPRSASRAA